MKKQLIKALAIGAFTLLTTTVGSAAPFSGTVYDDFNTSNPQQTLINLSNGNYTNYWDATFSVTKINFDTNDYGANWTNFLTGDGNNGFVAGTNRSGYNLLTDSISTSTSHASFLTITGNAYFSSIFDIIHDDGIILKIQKNANTWVTFDSSTPTSELDSKFHLSDYSLSAGNYNFKLYYEAWNGTPEVLKANFGTPVPEPATMLLFGAGIASLAGVARRKRS